MLIQYNVVNFLLFRLHIEDTNNVPHTPVSYVCEKQNEVLWARLECEFIRLQNMAPGKNPDDK